MSGSPWALGGWRRPVRLARPDPPGLAQLALLLRAVLDSPGVGPSALAMAGPGGATGPVPAVVHRRTAGHATTVRRRLGRVARTGPAAEADDRGADEPVGADAAEELPEQSQVESWELVRRAQDGDSVAFGQLYDRYVKSVYRFVLWRVHDRMLAEDFTSETFMRALRRIDGITFQGRDVGAWFMTIARNIILDHAKSARARLEVVTAEGLDRADASSSTEQAVLSALDARRLVDGIKQLGDEQRECVQLRFIQGLSVAETAAAMGKNDGAVKALQHRAVRKLADILGPELQ